MNDMHNDQRQCAQRRISNTRISSLIDPKRMEKARKELFKPGFSDKKPAPEPSPIAPAPIQPSPAPSPSHISQSVLNRQLIDASARGDLGEIKRLLSSGADVDAHIKSLLMPLEAAAFNGQTKALELLIGNGADVNAKNPDSGRHALFSAAALPDKDAAEFLISAGASAYATDDRMLTPLHLAAGGGRPEIVELLLSNYADINARDKSGFTPLAFALISYKFQGPSYRVVSLIVKKAVKIDAEIPWQNKSISLVDYIKKQKLQTVKSSGLGKETIEKQTHELKELISFLKQNIVPAYKNSFAFSTAPGG